MKLFSTISKRIDEWHDGAAPIFSISGAHRAVWSQIFCILNNQKQTSISDKNHLLICPTIEIAEEVYLIMKHSLLNRKVHLFPGYEASPYESIIPSEQALFARFNQLSNLKQDQVIIATAESATLLNPPLNFFKSNAHTITQEQLLAPTDLAKMLVSLGYVRSNSVEEPGTFATRGEIFDIYPVGGDPVRLHYYDELIENIHPIELETQRSDRKTSIECVYLFPSPHIITQAPFRSFLRDSLPRPQLSSKGLSDDRRNILTSLSKGEIFPTYPYLLPLAFECPETLISHTQRHNFLITLLEGHHLLEEYSSHIEGLLSSYDNYISHHESATLVPSAQHLYDCSLPDTIAKHRRIIVDDIEVSLDLDLELSNKVELSLTKISSYLRTIIPQGDINIRQALGSVLSLDFEHSGAIVFTYSTESAKEEINHIIQNLNLPSSLRSRFVFLPAKLSEGFFYASEKTLIISDADLFGYKTTKTKLKSTLKSSDPFAEQLATLKVDDFVIHSEHGIGRYIGLETLETSGVKADFLVIEYANNDKVYTPVYKMNLISKHSESTAGLKVANLRSNKFSQQINRAKESAKKLAFDLINLEAKRRSYRSHSFSPPDSLFSEFEHSFPFTETQDQSQAIHDVVLSMQKQTPMDYLVCGDVGFGKTEVAMRAALLAVLDKKQVAILVPTTILALQHYLSFQKRFKNFPVRIDFLSRFRTNKERAEVKRDLQDGKVDIIIGTHTLLSESIKYSDLGLLVVDEEHRFGVNHKEKIKVLRSTIDCLTLSATPIPRTLQLAFMGLKELSLIQTPPPKRQSVKTYLIKEDDHTLKVAIEKELNRGGQVFFVHNRVKTIDRVHQKLKEIVPDASIVIAHGQLPERELENRMRQFYLGKYQILLATTIIESGIDIPTANTLIVDRADCFGLAQLHQLRGRIGRSDKKAYAYFVIPNKMNDIARTRLQTLQTFSQIGSGFSIASSDLEIRGAGNILGAEQSGHIEAIGLELYMELIKEAVSDLKNEVRYSQQSIAINTPFPAFIPNIYITDPAERLKTYKKLANCNDKLLLDAYREDLVDIYGVYPQEVANLFTILEAKVVLLTRGILSVNVAGSIATITFDKPFLDRHPIFRDKILDYFMSMPRRYQLSPNYSVTYTSKEEITPDSFLQFAKDIAEQIVLC